MSASASSRPSGVTLRLAVVLRVQEETCEVLGGRQPRSVRYAPMFPAPRVERVSPGHLVAVAVAPDGSGAVIWRWYDAVVLGGTDRRPRLWEPSHGEVEAQARSERRRRPGTRAYLSAGLPGADWWVAGAAVAEGGEADVELDEVERLYAEHDLWGGVL